MFRRRRDDRKHRGGKHDDGRGSGAAAPASPAPAPPSAPPAGAALPPPVAEPTVAVIGGDDPHPSAQVLDELRGFFGGRSTPRPPAPPAPDGPAPGAGGPGIDPADLVPEHTKHSGRRSRKEARREARAEKRRLAAHAKAADAAPASAPPSAPTPMPSPTAPTAPLPPPADAASFDSGGEGVRIVSGPRRPLADPLVAPPTAAPPVAAPPPTAPPAGVPSPAASPGSAAHPSTPATSTPGTTTPDTTTPETPDTTDADTPPLAAPVPDGPRATITIVDDVDLPDAVYLDTATADAPGDEAPKRVFIDDSDAQIDGEFLAVDVASAAGRIEPRLRERRAQVKKESRHRRLRWVAVVVIVAGVALSSLAVLGSSLFAVDDVRIEGVAYSAGPEFDAILDDLVGTNVFRIDTSDFAERIEALPWVDDARVSVRFPGSATVEVRERTPAVAFLGADNRYRVLDGKGRVVAVIEGRPTAYIEVFVDNPLDLEAGMIAPRGYTAAATLATMLPVFGPAVAEIRATQDGSDLSMVLRTVDAEGQPHDINVRLGVAENLEAKLTRLLAKLEELGPDIGTKSSIDVSTRNTITS